MEEISLELDNETLLKIEKLAAERKISVEALINESVRILVSIADSDPIYDIAQAAARLGTTERHIRALIRHKRSPLPHFKVGRKLRFRESELVTWMDDGLSLPARRARTKLLAAA